MFGPSFDRTRLDNLTLGLDRYAARNLHQAPAGHRAAVGDRAGSPRGCPATYDAVLMPTLAEETPRIGHLDPTADYDRSWTDCSNGWLHAAAERHRRPRDLVAARGIRVRACRSA